MEQHAVIVLRYKSERFKAEFLSTQNLEYLTPIFSSPEPLGSQGELIGWP